MGRVKGRRAYCEVRMGWWAEVRLSTVVYGRRVWVRGLVWSGERVAAIIDRYGLQ